MKDQWDGCGNHVLLIRDEAVSERYGLAIPDNGKQKANTGTIFSFGSTVEEPKIKKKKKALFNKTAGFEIELPEGDVITVLRSVDVIAVK